MESMIGIAALNEKIQRLESEIEILRKNHIEEGRAKELYLKIFEKFPALIWRSRLDMLCDYFNKTWLDFTGRTMEQEFGNGWTEGVHPDDLQNCFNIYVSSFEKREAFVMEYRMKNNKGEYCWIRDYGRPFYDLDNQFLGYIGSCYDITENKNNEFSLIELNATKGKFFSIIGHDLKNPINSIIALSDMLVKNIDNKAIVEKLALTVQQSSLKIMDLLQHLLSWAQSQSGSISVKQEPVNIAHLIKENISLFSEVANIKSIAIDFVADKETLVFIDQAMIKTVIRNLISNAIKYSYPDERILITIEEADNKLLVSITDYGVGIPKSSIDKLFKIEYSCSTKGTRNESGTGLGLILCHEFINKHQSSIWVESEEGKGSSFKFTLPLFSEN